MQWGKPFLKKVWHNAITQYVFNHSLYALLRLFFSTYRLKVHYHPTISPQSFITQSAVFYFWHQQIIGSMFFFFKTKSTGSCVVSPSFDGKIAGFACQKLGFNVIYGSPYKNPISLTRQSLQALKKSGRLCLVGDGSRGPAFKLQKGIEFLARKTSVPLIFIECKPTYTFTLSKSWDKFQIPLPFSKINIIVHPALLPPTDR